jgi:type IV pilus assembly protein PilY1
MSVPKSDHLLRFGIIAIAFSLSLLMTAPPAISQPCAVPPASGGVSVLPNVLVIFDNSGSMTEYAHQNAYDSAVTYAGIFDSGLRYHYSDTGGYFQQAAGGEWSGNFLNWACMLKIDVARKIMTGGKVIIDGSNTYITANTYTMDTNPDYNERSYTDTSGQTPYSGTYRYGFINNASYEWGRLRVRDNTPTTIKTCNIRILVDAGYEAHGLLHDLEGQVRLGLMHFNDSDYQGGYIQQPVRKLVSNPITHDGHLDNIVTDLNRDLGDDYDWTYTPLAETLYSATRYFSQVAPGSYYHAGDYPVGKGTIDDPLYNEDYNSIVWCARNYVILLTDGQSTRDQSIPSNLQDYDEDGCDPCPCTCADYTCSCPLNSSGTAYLDDIAAYAYATDLRDGAGEPQDMQNLITHTVYMFGQPGWADVLLEKTADNEHGHGLYRRAENADDIIAALGAIFEQITGQAAAAASVAITSEAVSGTNLIYIPYFKHPGDNQWWGNIRAFELGIGGNLIDNTGGVAYDHVPGDGVLDDPIWDVAVELQSMNRDNRNIFTSISNTKAAFDASTVGKYFDVDLNGDSTEESAEIDALISYIRGTDNPGGFTLRGRNNYYLGDIIHASPAFVGKPSARYDLLYGDIDYWDFYWTYDDRTQVLYAGANDGMLHCFDASNGQELWAYIPYNLLSHLKWLADPNYCHCFYVDLSATVRDIRVNGDWKSVLLGGMRLGGTPDGVDTSEPPDGTSDETLRSAFFAIDVTDPHAFITSDAVLWEISSDSFGYTTSNPIPVKVEDTWYLVFGSGPKTRDGEGDPTAGGGDGYTDNYAHIFVVNPSTGDIVTTINVGTSPGSLGENNFFGPPVAIDYDLDYSVDAIYIGDAKGNLWRIKTFAGPDASKTTYITNPEDWIIDVDEGTTSDIDPLLSLGTDQPITIKPTVSKDDKGRVWIYFGTGRYFCANDNTYCGEGNECATSGDCIESESVGDRSKYMAVGVYDRHWDSTAGAGAYVLQSNTLDADPDPSSVLDHRVIKQGEVAGSPGVYGYYIVDADTGQDATDVSTSTNGWYFHLLDPKERCLGDFTIYRGAVFFITFTPDDTDPCARGGLSNLYGVYYTSGTSTTLPLFDLTADENIDSDDLVTDGANLFGPAMMNLDKGFPGGGLQIKEGKGVTPLPDKTIDLNPPGDEGSTGVTSWREVLP